jgi:hypothetical protein
MASVTGNMAKKYWDDFGIVGPRTQLLKHRTLTTLILGNRPLRGPGSVPWHVPELRRAPHVRTVTRDAALWDPRSDQDGISGGYPHALPTKEFFQGCDSYSKWNGISLAASRCDQF